MHSFTAPTLALATLAAIPAVSAHGYVSGVVAGGTYHNAGSPSWIYQSTKPQQAGWFAKNQDNGFVAPDAYGTDDITCHIDATPGNTYIPLEAGETIDLQWTVWPESHHGPVMTYLARCPGGDCTSVDKSKLKFFKIDEGGLVDGSASPGTWADDDMIANNNTWTTTIPSSLSGNFVMRHEIIALHSAGTENGAQNYPNCINVKISGSSNAHPCRAGADCRLGTALYKSTDPGILINIYTTLSSYKIPGPAVWSGLKKRAGLIARSFSA